MKTINIFFLCLFIYGFSHHTVMPYRPPNRIYFENNHNELSENSLLRLDNWISYIKTPGLTDTSLIILKPMIFNCDSFTEKEKINFNYHRAIQIKRYLNSKIKENLFASILIDPVALYASPRECESDSTFVGLTLINCFKDSIEVEYIHLKRY